MGANLKFTVVLDYILPVVPLKEADANMCCTLLFQDKNEISPWAADPVPCRLDGACIKIDMNKKNLWL